MKHKFRDLQIPEAKLKHPHPRREECATEREENVSSPGLGGCLSDSIPGKFKKEQDHQLMEEGH